VFYNECVKFILEPLVRVTRSVGSQLPQGVILEKDGVQHHVYIDVSGFACDMGDMDVFFCFGGAKSRMGDPRALIPKEYYWGLVQQGSRRTA
jgi:hypothetical protein